MSEKSYKKWLFFKPLSKYLYNRFSLIVSQDITNAKRYKVLGGRNIISDINLKNAVAANHMNQKDREEMVLQISKRQILLFASIHDNIEDQAAIISHIQAKNYNKNILTIIVPRHPKKIKNLIALANIHNLKTRIRSYNQAIDYNTEIYIADTIGELGTFMQIADICFVGGSLSNKGGHNLIEPAIEKCAIIYGPDVSNHKNTSDMLLKGAAAIQVQNIDELNIEIGNLILNKEKITKMASDAYKIITNIPSPSSILLNKLKPYL
ncbi:MAG: hypothetical protein HOE34_01865, partial [Pelagibacterales bacterium]|nr:hypothetical protein [Pelagibacterales bacterium]